MSPRLVEETENLSSNVLPAGLLMVHDACRGSHDDISELTSRQQLHNPLLEICQADVVPGGDDTALVQAAIGQQLTAEWKARPRNEFVRLTGR